jgi:hypothetical protein
LVFRVLHDLAEQTHGEELNFGVLAFAQFPAFFNWETIWTDFFFFRELRGLTTTCDFVTTLGANVGVYRSKLKDVIIDPCGFYSLSELFRGCFRFDFGLLLHFRTLNVAL